MRRITLCSIALLLAISWRLPAAETPAGELVGDVRLGLAVHLGSSDGQWAADLAKRGFRLVHGLALDDEACERVRKTIGERGLTGVASVETARQLRRLPYVDNLVNLVVADLDELGGRAPERAELERVLAPGGVAILKQGGKWVRWVKPRPAGMDDWGHPLYGPDESKSSRDQLVGVPAGVQWLAGPVFTVANRKTSTEGIVTAGGRCFFITQNELSNFESKQKTLPNYLVARDAFNGLLLWQRPSANQHVGRAGLVNPRLVATDRHVYVVENGQVVALDAATGRLLHTYRTAGTPEKFLLRNGLLIVETPERVTVFEADSGKERWGFSAGTQVLSGSAAGEDYLCVFAGSRDEGRSLIVLDLASGKEAWRRRLHDGDLRPYSKGYQDLAFLHMDCIGLISPEKVRAHDRRTGKELWSRELTSNRYGTTYQANGLVWVLDRSTLHGLEPLTGKERRQAPSPANIDPCQFPLAAGQCVIDPRHPTVVDLESGSKASFDWVRGGCGPGFVAANGLLYTVPTACACYRDMLRGFVAVTPLRRAADSDESARMEKGPAHGAALPAAPGNPAEDWPTFRHDPQRSAYIDQAMAHPLRELWRTTLASGLTTGDWQLRVGPAFTAPVIAGGKVFVAQPDAHRLTALDVRSGQPSWHFFAGGRIDSPPTIFNGLCLFGARDGWIYCLRAADGQLAWRFRAAPADQRLVAFGQLESVWPVLGSVLVHDGVAYAAAGRAPGADGGLQVHALDPQSGRCLWTTTLAKGIKGGLPDLLVSNGKALCLADYEIDWKTGEARKNDGKTPWLRGGIAGLLEASWTRLPIALRKDIQTCRYGDVSGQLLAFAETRVWGYDTTSKGREVRKSDDQVFAAGTGGKGWRVTVEEPVQGEALIGTRDHLFLAGVLDREQRSAGGFLRVLGRDDGKLAAEHRLASPPVYQGLAAAAGRLFLVTEGGEVICLGP